MSACTICQHQAVGAMNAAMATGQGSLAGIAATYHVSRDALRRHKRAHLGPALSGSPLHAESPPAPPASAPPPSAVARAEQRLEAIQDEERLAVAAIADGHQATRTAQRRVLEALARGSAGEEAQARAAHQAAVQHVAQLEQRRADLLAALPLACQVLEEAQHAQRQHEYAHWLTVSQRPELAAEERWCCQLLAGVQRPALEEELRKFFRPEMRVALVAELKQRFPFVP